MRCRAWRRYKEDQKVIKRTRTLLNGGWYRYVDVNNIRRYDPLVQDFIGSSHIFGYKTYTSSKYDSKYKRKYSPNRSKGYHIHYGYNTRPSEKINFLKILKDNEIR